jgi:Leucine-rich repeat (LRR) protein
MDETNKMNKNLPTIKQDSALTLKKAKKLIGIVNEILKNSNPGSIDDIWTEKIWKWADQENISSKIIPREKRNLMKLGEVNLYGYGLNSIPEEIIQLKNLTFLELTNNNLTQLPLNIGELEKLNFLSIGMNNLKTIPESIVNLKNLKNFWFSYNNNLQLNKEQLSWIEDLKNKGCYIY